MPSHADLFNELKNLSTGLNSGVYGQPVNLIQSIFLIHHPENPEVCAVALSYKSKISVSCRP